MDFYTNLNAICKSKGISVTGLLNQCKISSGSCTYWKKGNMPSSKTLEKLSSALGISTETLLGKSQTITPQQFAENIFQIPVYESVSAGFGTTAIDDVIDYYPVRINNSADVCNSMCLKVKGDSMYPKIEDGDIIVVRKQLSVDNGAIAVVLIDNNDGLVKKIEYDNDCIKLISINPMYPPMIFTGEDRNKVSIIGLVQQIHRNCN